jgi:DNA-directed RNA polymerase subunit RPC12/RpoP
MATTDDSLDGMTEHCASCETDTLHQVSVQIMTESQKEENTEFSREPYRVAECQRCGSRRTQRMNNV